MECAEAAAACSDTDDVSIPHGDEAAAAADIATASAAAADAELLPNAEVARWSYPCVDG